MLDLSMARTFTVWHARTHGYMLVLKRVSVMCKCAVSLGAGLRLRPVDAKLATFITHTCDISAVYRPVVHLQHFPACRLEHGCGYGPWTRNWQRL